jgi:conjugal transfer pilin signal peptidase TrbI
MKIKENFILLYKELKTNYDFQRKFLLGLVGAIFGIIITYIYYPKIPYRLGLIDTPSIYKKIVIYELKQPVDIQRDKLYVFSFSKDTRYFKKGDLFIKYTKCLPGDKLEVKGLKYYCNGKYFATAQKTDSKGRPVKHFVYSGIVPDGKVFMYAPHPRSYDSRYWGFLDEDKIIGEVKWQLLNW